MVNSSVNFAPSLPSPAPDLFQHRTPLCLVGALADARCSGDPPSPQTENSIIHNGIIYIIGQLTTTHRKF
jgi:hypothetical protein